MSDDRGVRDTNAQAEKVSFVPPVASVPFILLVLNPLPMRLPLLRSRHAA